MFHDDIIHSIRFDAGEIEDYQDFVKEDPAVFYYHENDLDENLIWTGFEFYENNILNLPFERCIFIKESDNDPRYAFWATTEGDDFTGFHMCEDGTMCSAIHKFSRDQNKPNQLKRIDDSYHQVTDDELFVNGGQTFNNIIAAIMLLNSVYTTKTQQDISDKLNKKRIKHGKEPLIGFTKIRLSTPTGIVREAHQKHRPAPHWRRGHIRKLSNGRVVPVSPCLVNYEGGQIPNKLYNIGKD